MMDDLTNLTQRAERLAADCGLSLSTVSRKIMNDGKGLARLQAGGQCTLKTLERALRRLVILEQKAGIVPSSPAKHQPPATDPMQGNSSHLDWLEAQSIHIFREVVAQSSNPVMLYSIGKDSSVMLHLALKAFYPAKLPFALLHVDTGWKFREMIEFRDQLANKLGLNLLVHQNQQGLDAGVGPFTHGSAAHTQIMKTEALKQALDQYGFDAAFGGARRDEEKSRAKERVFSFRDSMHHWDPKKQRPELWNIYNTQVGEGQSIRVFPLSNWTEMDIWQYIHRENIAIPSLYFAKRRAVVCRDGKLLMVDDDRFALQPGEKVTQKMVRFRTLGCYPLTAAVASDAQSVPEVIRETLLAKTSEREGRIIDSDIGASMEAKKQEGYF